MTTLVVFSIVCDARLTGKSAGLACLDNFVRGASCVDEVLDQGYEAEAKTLGWRVEEVGGDPGPHRIDVCPACAAVRDAAPIPFPGARGKP